MAAPRATQFLALRALARRPSPATRQIRQLHMTGPATSSATPKASASHEDRSPRRTTTSSSPPPTRHFNTSRPTAAARDGSTIDVAFLPSADTLALDEGAGGEAMRIPRMPILPDRSTGHPAAAAAAMGREAVEAEAPVMRPTIRPLSADAVFLPMAELSDGHAEQVDFAALAEGFGARKEGNVMAAAAAVEEKQGEKGPGLVGRVWGDFVDDVLGRKPTANAAVV